MTNVWHQLNIGELAYLAKFGGFPLEAITDTKFWQIKLASICQATFFVYGTVQI